MSTEDQDANGGTPPPKERDVKMADLVTLLHSLPRSSVEQVRRQGLRPTSGYDDLGLDMRRGVVYCWLTREHDKIYGKSADRVHIGVTVDRSRCRVADMEFSSIALMYLQGQGGKPQNAEAARLLANLYEMTSVLLSEYRDGMFCTPEVLVQGEIRPEDITPCS